MPATTHIGARIDTGLVGRFGLLAARAGRSFSRELEAAMRDHLAHAEQRERISRMSLDELDTYLAGVDGREDERPPRAAAVVESPPTETASDGTD